MNDGGFERVTHSDRALYGTRKLLLCGFPVPAQSKFGTVLQMAGLAELPVVWVDEARQDDTLSNLFDLPHGTGEGKASTLDRAVIVGGITEKQLHALMSTCRKTGMRQTLWAVLTPTSENWSLSSLLSELNAERKALARRKK